VYEYEAACECGRCWRFRDDHTPAEMEFRFVACVNCGLGTNDIRLLGSFFEP
jgi:hypothetical protein